MLVDTSDSERSFLDWSPEYFIKEFGEVSCRVASNRSGKEQSSTVGDFFRSFGVDRSDNQIWKIKVLPLFISSAHTTSS